MTADTKTETKSFKVGARDLQNAVAMLASIVPASTIPLLECIRLRTIDEDTLELSATNLDMQGDVRIPCAVVDAGELLMNGRRLTDIIRHMEGRLQITSKDCHITIRSKSARASHPEFIAAPFTSLPVEDGDSFTVKAAELMRAINSVSHCVEKGTARQYLDGVAIEGSDQLTIIGASGHRMAAYEIEGVTPPEFSARVVASPGLPALLRMLGSEPDTAVRVVTSENRFTFYGGAWVFTIKMLGGDATFPDWRRLFQIKGKTWFEVSADHALPALALINSVSMDRTPRARFTGRKSGTQFRLDDNTAGTAESIVRGKTSAKEGEDIVCLNAAYASEAIRQTEAETVRFGVDDPNSPALVTAEGSPLRQVVMGMRI